MLKYNDFNKVVIVTTKNKYWGKIARYDQNNAIITVKPLNPKYRPQKIFLPDIKHFYRAIPLGCGWYAGKNEQALQDAKNRRAVVFDKVSNTESQRPIVVDFESNK